MTSETLPFLSIGRRIRVLPVIHGSGDFALEVRRAMLAEEFDCVAVPLPPSFQRPVEEAIPYLPAVSMVAQLEERRYRTEYQGGEPRERDEGEEHDAAVYNYVPIDPCQPVIAALRIALGEHTRRAFIDLEVERFEPYQAVLPDPYALKKVPVEKFAAAMLPAIPPPRPGQHAARIAWMARRLRELEQRHKAILFVCSILDWPWIRAAYGEPSAVSRQPSAGGEPGHAALSPGHPPGDPALLDEPAAPPDVNDPETYRVAPETLAFVLGELPFITGLYERARQDLFAEDENLSVEGVKELALEARDRYRRETKAGRKITPQLLSLYFRYVRNLTLVERRLTPDLYTLVVAAKQVCGDAFAIALAETAREYPFAGAEGWKTGAAADRNVCPTEADKLGAATPASLLPWDELRMGVTRGQLPGGEIALMKNRLAGQAVVWRSLQLQPKPKREQVERWRQRWNPFKQCSWPPEDVAIESFHTHVRDQAKALIGADLARSEKFTTSIKDGLDLRETLRHWHKNEIYVKVIPPSRGSIEVVVMLFDVPADPRDYPWRTTWYAEHGQESTLALYATDFRKDLVGPGIGRAIYGGAVFLFPPRAIPDIWTDRRLNVADTLEERLLAAAFFHSAERYVAVVSPGVPLLSWRRLAKHFGRKMIHLPLSRFGASTIERLRTVHVLNGRDVRSYAAEYIRKM